VSERRRLYLLRHGEVAYFDEEGRPHPPDEVGLTPAGERQARSAGEALSDVDLDRVIASGLRRTLETAAIAVPGAEIETWPELRELRPASLEGLPEDEIEAAFTSAFAGPISPERGFLNGETIGELLDRVVPAVERLLADETWHTALAVLHGGVNRAILSYALTGERRFFGGIEQAPGCINVLDVGDGGWIVRTVNYAPYDPVHESHRLTTMEQLFMQYRPHRTDRETHTRRR
jgi:broad specificity phosphatase PhoE